MPLQKNQRNFFGNALDSFDKVVAISPITLIFGGIILISAAVLITYVSLALKLNNGGQQANNLQPQPIVPAVLTTPKPWPSVDILNKIEDSKEIPGWKTFNGKYYVLSFPSNWDVLDQ